MDRKLRRTDWEGYNLGNTDPNQRGLKRGRHRRRFNLNLIDIVGLVSCLVILGVGAFVVWRVTRG